MATMNPLQKTRLVIVQFVSAYKEFSMAPWPSPEKSFALQKLIAYCKWLSVYFTKEMCHVLEIDHVAATKNIADSFVFSDKSAPERKEALEKSLAILFDCFFIVSTLNLGLETSTTITKSMRE